ncbi:MAG: zinc ribbon domain-containing protein [Pseudobutyrivibrio sp.]|nr:zinc ribbon domain-containing protein [Pseudobutyrivibrio sp.]
MFCENCGTQLEDGAVFCTNCGAKQSAPEVAPGFTPEQGAAPAAPKISLGERIKKVPVIAWIIIAVVIVAAIVGGVFLYKASHTINVNDYITVEFDGYDTMGTATVELDETFWEDLYEKANFKDKKKLEKDDDFGFYYTEGDYMQDELSGKIRYEVDPSTELSNGDEVTVSWKVKTKSIKKKFGVTIKAEDSKHKVEDLEEVKTFDPFEAVTVTFTGIDGSGEANVEVTSEDDIYDDFSFSTDPSYNLSEGDTVTVTFAPYYDEEDLNEYTASEYGMIASAKEKEYTVEGLGKYVATADELTEDGLADVIADCATELEDDANLSDKETWNNAAYKGAYVMTMDDATGGNYVYLLFECTVDLTGDDGDTDSITYYSYVEASDVSINEDGKCAASYVYAPVYDSLTYESTFGDSFRYYGYESYEECRTVMDDSLSYYAESGRYNITSNFADDQ